MFSFLKQTKGKKRVKEEILDFKTDIGLIRKNNEDSVITIVRDDANIKLLAVADGVGGADDGEVASNFAIETLANWFRNSDLEDLKDTSILKNNLKDIVLFINNYLYMLMSNHFNCSTTLTIAIVNDTHTIVANVGDSRAYITKNSKLTQVTRDDSLVWFYYEQGQLKKNQMRFHKDSNLITQSIGSSPYVTPNITVIDNNYDGLFLFTDGITDCLSEKEIEKIIMHNKDNLANEIINHAVYGSSKEKVPAGQEFHKPMNGKDNASVALYFKTEQYI